MRKIKLPTMENITDKLIIDLINKHLIEKNRIIKMKDYYKNQNDIFNRQYTDSNKPQNKLSHNYANYITNSYVGYFMGKPITYKSDNISLLEKLNDIFMYNDEADANTDLASEISICGYGYEVVYQDENAITRFKPLNTEEMICVYDNTLQENIQFAIRYYDIYTGKEDEKSKEVVLYTKNEIIKYELKDDKLTLIDSEIHYFEDVPISDYENNRNRIGDYENVISLINAYDNANSDTANDFEYFTNALLVISGILLEEKDEQGRPLNFKDNRVLTFADAQSRAEYLIKNINDTALENYKNRLNSDIHKFSQVIDLSDENFASNLSGIAMKYKLSGMEHITGIKESKFKKGLMRRIELILKVLKIKLNNEFAFTEIKPVFTRNIPANEVELVAIAKQLYGIVSEETLLSILPFIDDVQAEKEAIEKEAEDKAITGYEELGNNVNISENITENNNVNSNVNNM